jgi:hypothetical protein
MPVHVADIPRPMYGYVKNQFLYDLYEGYNEYTECLIFGLSALPGRAWGISALLKTGALVQHLPPHAFTNTIAPKHHHQLDELQVWSCYGYNFATIQYDALSEMPCKVYMKTEGRYETGTYWFTAAPYDDMYSMTPDQHKHFNFIWLDCGCLASLPGNRVQMYDSSFVEMPTERPKYRVNTRYWYPENAHTKNPFDNTITPFTA